MSYVIAAPEFVSPVATDLANIGSAISSANMISIAPTGGSGGTGGLLLGADGIAG
jgi:hypothetical protein